MDAFKNRQKRFLLLSIILNILFFLLGFELFTFVGIDHLRHWIEGFGVFAPLGYGLLYFALLIIPFNPVPKLTVMYFALLSFRPLSALIATLLAELAGISVNYFLAKRFSQFFINRFGKNFQEMVHYFGSSAILVSRLLPAGGKYVGTDFPSYAAGFLEIPFWHFVLASMIPWLVLDALYFYALDYFADNKLLFYLFIPLFVASMGYGLYRVFAKKHKS